MRVVIQRVKEASVRVKDELVAGIGNGLLILLGVGKGDVESDAGYLVDKIVNLRIFEDQNGKMNRSLIETGGSLLVVSQFTLLGDCKKGRRPSFVKAATPEPADSLYKYFVEQVSLKGVPVKTGIFGAMMDIHLINNGPVTLIIDSKSNVGERGG